MKGLSVIIAGFILVFGTVASRGANPVDRISAETGVPVDQLQAERTSTGLGWGGLENAHLLANASGQSFDTIVGKFQAHEGWGQIAHDYGLNLGKVVSAAHRSSQATAHAQNTQAVHGKSSTSHGKSATKMGKGHTSKMTTTRGVAHRSSFRSGFSGSHGMHSMGHMGGGRGR
jgi:6,7-dimethyl-8-ribityllumazine synthase